MTGGGPPGRDVPLLPVRLQPQPLEVACGIVLGTDEEAPPLAVEGSDDPRAEVEAAVRSALRRDPCLVSFSGGRDSSAVLATAVAVARREGLPLPVAATYRFAEVPTSLESDWQERVVAHLGLKEWERIPITSELDSVGPVARAVLTRHGLLWPFNAHFHAPLLERAQGGSLLTGIGGDELFSPQLWSSARTVLAGRRRPQVADLRTVGLALAPRPLRRRRLARHRRTSWPWLRPEVEAVLHRQMDDWRARTPLRWDRAVGRWWQSRYHTVLTASMEAMALAAGAQVVHPFMEEAVVASSVRRFGARGPADRRDAMRALFGDLLPDPVLSRPTKASFDAAFFAEHSRSFLHRWPGGGIDGSLVDAERLNAAWSAPHPDPRSFLLIQAAWLRAG